MDAWELADAVGRGIDEAFAAATGEMVTQWVAVVEFMDADGKRWKRTLTPRDAAYWNTVGLLRTAADEQHAAVTEEAP